MQSLGAVVSPEVWIGCSEDRGSGVEGGSDAGFGDGDGLLLHCLVDGCSVRLGHLVELINTAYPHIS